MSLPPQLTLYAQRLQPLLPAFLEDLAADALYTPVGHPTRRRGKVQQLAAIVGLNDPISLRTVNRLIDMLLPEAEAVREDMTWSQLLVLLNSMHKETTKERKTKAKERPPKSTPRGPRGAYKPRLGTLIKQARQLPQIGTGVQYAQGPVKLPPITDEQPTVDYAAGMKLYGVKNSMTAEETQAELEKARLEKEALEAQAGTSMFG